MSSVRYDTVSEWPGCRLAEWHIHTDRHTYTHNNLQCLHHNWHSVWLYSKQQIRTLSEQRVMMAQDTHTRIALLLLTTAADLLGLLAVLGLWIVKQSFIIFFLNLCRWEKDYKGDQIDLTHTTYYFMQQLSFNSQLRHQSRIHTRTHTDQPTKAPVTHVCIHTCAWEHRSTKYERRQAWFIYVT